MFDIEYKGGNCVVISGKSSKVVIDPKLSEIGMKDVTTNDSIIVATEERFLINDPSARLIIDGPGEYEVGDFSIRGISPINHIDIGPTGQASNIYRIDVGDVRMAVLGNITDSLSEDQLESIGVVDLVMMPISGDGYTLSREAAAQVVRQIDPKVVIPIRYVDNSAKVNDSDKELASFVTEIGAPVESTSKYRVKSPSSLPATITIVDIQQS